MASSLHQLKRCRCCLHRLVAIPCQLHTAAIEIQTKVAVFHVHDLVCMVITTHFCYLLGLHSSVVLGLHLSLLLLGHLHYPLLKLLIAPFIMLHRVSGINSLYLFVDLILVSVPSFQLTYSFTHHFFHFCFTTLLIHNSLFHLQLKTYLFHKSYPPHCFTSCSQTAFTDFCPHHFF